MNFNSKFFIGLYFFLTVISKGEEKDRLLDIHQNLFNLITHSLTDSELQKLRTCSKGINAKVQKYLVSKYVTKPMDKEINDLFRQTDVGYYMDNFPRLLKSFMKEKIDERLSTIIKQEGYIFVLQGSMAQGYLAQRYQRISLQPYLATQAQDWAKEMFRTLFGMEMTNPEQLGHLVSCLPFNHLYIEKNKDEKSAFRSFKSKYSKELTAFLQKKRKSQKYFLVGYSKPTDLQKAPHTIVVNQSKLTKLKELNPYLPHDHPHTVLLNVEQERLKLRSEDLPPNTLRLILTDSKNLCKEIGDNFLYPYSIWNAPLNLVSCEMRGMANVGTIGSDFFGNYSKLITFNSRGLTDLREIGNNFLDTCSNLNNVETLGFANVETIANSFMKNCIKLENFNTNDFPNLKKIGDQFLVGSDALTSFDTNGFQSLEKIGDGFLACCFKLALFNPRGLINLRDIGEKFLSHCNNLSELEIGGFKKVQRIQMGFLSSSGIFMAEEIKKKILEQSSRNARFL